MAQFNTKNKSSRVARRWFSDIDINMAIQPESKDLSLKYDLNAIKRSMKNILLTNHYERPFKPSFGVNLRNMLFELASNETKIVKRQIIIYGVETQMVMLWDTAKSVAILEWAIQYTI